MATELTNFEGGERELIATEIREMLMGLRAEFVAEAADIKKRLTSVEDNVAKNSRHLLDIEEEYTLLPSEAEELQKAVQSRVVSALGGKDSNAYKNKDLSKRVFMDAWYLLKREYGLIDDRGRQKSYKKLKRKYLRAAIAFAGEYIPPIAIANEIQAENEINI